MNYTSGLAPSTNVGGYPASMMYTYIKNDIYNALSNDLKNIIISTKVLSGHGATSGETNFLNEDKLYLLSPKELSGKTKNVINYDTAEAQTRQLDYYKDVVKINSNSFSGAIKKYNGTSSDWWLRTASPGDTGYFFGVSDSGSWVGFSAKSNCGVAPAFRIG